MSDEEELNDFDDDADDDDGLDFDCHMDRSGLCGAAGSEDCDFLCPYRADQIAEENAREKRKTKVKP